MSHHSHTRPFYSDLAVVGLDSKCSLGTSPPQGKATCHVRLVPVSFCIDNVYYFTRHNRQLLLVCVSLCESGIPCTFWHDPVERKRKCINILFNLQKLCFSLFLSLLFSTSWIFLLLFFTISLSFLLFSSHKQNHCSFIRLGRFSCRLLWFSFVVW